MLYDLVLIDSKFQSPFTTEFAILLSSNGAGAVHNLVESQKVTNAKKEGTHHHHRHHHLPSDNPRRVSRALNQTNYDRVKELQREGWTRSNHSRLLFSLIFYSHILLNYFALVNFSQEKRKLPCSIDQSLHHCIHSLDPLARLRGSCDLPLPHREF